MIIETIVKSTRGLRYALLRLFNKEEDILNFKGIHKGQPLLIVGNGPSLNKTPLEEFKNIPSIGMNKINLLFKKTEWRPSYIITLNGLVIRQNLEFFNSSDIPKFFGSKARFMGVKGKSNHFILEKPNSDFEMNVAKYGFGTAGTVTYAALQLAYWMEADPIIIVGVDHSFKLDDHEKLHKVVSRKQEDLNHFDPNYFEKGKKWGVPNLPLSEFGYSIAKHEFEKRNIKIYDATIGGKLDIFEKISIEQAVDLVKK